MRSAAASNQSFELTERRITLSAQLVNQCDELANRCAGQPKTGFTKPDYTSFQQEEILIEESR